MAALVEPRSHPLTLTRLPTFVNKNFTTVQFSPSWSERWKTLKENQPPTLQWC
jgi:hypothetical protein